MSACVFVCECMYTYIYMYNSSQCFQLICVNIYIYLLSNFEI